MRGAVRPGDGHPQRMDRGCLGTLDALNQLVRGIIVHQKAEPPAIQAEHRPFMGQRFMQDMQHVAIAAKRDDAVGCLYVGLAIAVDKPRQTFLRHLMCRS
jgi:hypothetical protein